MDVKDVEKIMGLINECDCISIVGIQKLEDDEGKMQIRRFQQIGGTTHEILALSTAVRAASDEIIENLSNLIKGSEDDLPEIS